MSEEKKTPKPRPGQIVVGDEEDPFKDGKYILCRWCQMDSRKKDFHVGSIPDTYDEMFWETICPKCTNVFAPDPVIQDALHKDPKDVMGVVVEENIVAYCRDHIDAFLLECRGNVPKLSTSLTPELMAQRIPKKYHDMDIDEYIRKKKEKAEAEQKV